MQDSEGNKTFNRRQFLKVSGAASAVLGSAGLGFYGYEAGRDPSTYTGWKTFEGGDQTFNRKRFAVDRPHYDRVGPTSRADGRTEVIFARGSYLRRQWNDDSGLAGLEPFLRAYYEEHPEDLELDLYGMKEIVPKQREDQRKYGRPFFIAEAWSNAMGAVSPEPITEPPEVSDFPRRRDGTPIEPVTLKSPEKTSKLIKKIAHELGSTLVGIARLNPDWVFQYPMWEWRGFKRDEPIEVPKHWEYAVVVGTPMSWDPLFANPSYGTSNDAYSISRIIAYRLASFIKQLGYAARPHTPGTSYDLMVPPICVDAGLGEQGRHSIVITPELGCNFRPAVVTTNLPLKPDNPIEFGVQEFCRTCKICAEQCPSGAITMGGKEDVRGYRRYQVHPSKCLNFWNSTLGSMGCRLCVAVCPYSRKANWVHKTALNVTTHDPTGISHAALTQLQKAFYPGQDPQTYYIPSLGGENASYRKPPWWLRTEDFIEL